MGGAGAAMVVPFEYPPLPAAAVPELWRGWDEEEPPGVGQAEEAAATEHAPQSATGSAEAELRAEMEGRLAEETARAFEAGRAQGREEGRQGEHEKLAAALAAAEKQRLRQAADLLESFTRERDRYLERVEHEVVGLALAVAARILRREAQMDPLLLTGAVRVALGQLGSSTRVRLRVPEADLALWQEAIALLPGLAIKPEVEAGEGMRVGECTLESELGTVDLGIRAQLGEIERGFFDRAVGWRSGGEAATASAREPRP
ncbi:MAG: FliH/SctL family protein [Terracidiphilus sp.]